MNYHSTRSEQLTASSTHAVLQGIAPDGGLYICDPARLDFDWRAALEKSTLDMAADILHALLPDFDDMPALVRASYKDKFPTSDLTPLTPVAAREAMEPVLDRGDDVLYVGLSGGVSGTCWGVSVVAQELRERYPDRDIRVLDSRGASLGEGLIVLEDGCLRLTRRGMDVQNAVLVQLME